MTQSSHNPRSAALLALMAAVSLVGCGEQTATRDNPATTRASAGLLADSGQRAAPAAADPQAGDAIDLTTLDLGEDWSDVTLSRGRADSTGHGRTANGRGDAGNAGEPYWSLVLSTFPDDLNGRAAATALRQLVRAAPELSAARVHTTPRGSMIVYGRYDAVEDPAAQRDLERLRSLSRGNRPLLPQVMLMPIDPRPVQALHPHELRSVREQYPNVDPLYTLQVAVWGDFDSGRVSRTERQRRAEAYAAELRARGYKAFFHHDEMQELSMVTVGLWGSAAVLDASTGLLHPDVKRIIDEFGEHLVNGEPLEEYINPLKPDLGTRVQKPHLVLVPEV